MEEFNRKEKSNHKNNISELLNKINLKPNNTPLTEKSNLKSTKPTFGLHKQNFDDKNIVKSIYQTIKSKINDSQTSIRKFKNGWDLIDKGYGRVAFFDPESSITYWCPPQNLWRCLYNVPYGFEVGINNDGTIYYINHESMTISFNIFGEKTKLNDQVGTAEKIGITIMMDEKYSNQNFGIEFEKNIPEVQISRISKESCFYKNLLSGDILLSVDHNHIQNIVEFHDSLKGKGQVHLKVLRKYRSPKSETDLGRTNKSNIISVERRKNSKFNPISVHFNDKPVILEYKRELESVLAVSESIEKNFSNVIKIDLETGMVKSILFTNGMTVGDIVNQITSKLNFECPECFTLALIAEGNSNIIFFNPFDSALTLIEKRKAFPEYSCRLLLFAIPPNIDEWNGPKYSSMIFYLFHQARNFVLRANMAWLSNLLAHDLHQLISFSATLEFILSGLQQLETIVNRSSADMSQKSQNESVDTEKQLKTRSSVPAGEIRLSSLKLEQWNYYNSWTALKNFRKDIDGYVIVNMMLQCFDEIVPAKGKVFLLGSPELCKSLDIPLDNAFKEELTEVCRRAETIFVKSTVASKIVGFYRFRVHLCRCHLTHIKINSNVIGQPYTFVVSSKEYGIEDQNGVYSKIAPFSSILGIVISFNRDSRILFNLFSSRNEPTTLIVKAEECQTLKYIIYSFASEIWLKVKNSSVPIIDLTCDSFTYKENDIKYSDYHLVLPSLWNYNSSINLFFTAYKLSCEKVDATPQERISNILPWLMIFKTQENDIDCKGSIGDNKLKICSHVSVFPSISNSFSSSNSITPPTSQMSPEKEKSVDEEEEKSSRLILADEMEIRIKGKKKKAMFRRSATENKIEEYGDSQLKIRTTTKLKTSAKPHEKKNSSTKGKKQ